MKISKKGFSMVELMIVITVLGILLSVAIPMFGTLMQAQNAIMCHLCKQTVYQKFTNYSMEDIDPDDYPDEKLDGNPFLEGVYSYNQNTDKLEDVFKQSFIDYIGGEENMPTCSVDNNYFVIEASGDLVIECHNKDGELTEEHNNSTIF